MYIVGAFVRRCNILNTFLWNLALIYRPGGPIKHQVVCGMANEPESKVGHIHLNILKSS